MTPDDRSASDDRIAALFREAASDASAPPPGFGPGDVLVASRRIAARRRSLLVAGAVAAVAGAVAGPAAAQPHNGTGDAATVAAPAEAAGAGSPLVATTPDEAPLGPGTTTCGDMQDPALRALLERVLPEVVDAHGAASTTICRPGSERGLSLEVTDRGTTGVLGVLYLPPGIRENPPAGAVSRPTRSGGTVTMSSFPDGSTGPAPFADRLASLAAYLAPRL